MYRNALLDNFSMVAARILDRHALNKSSSTLMTTGQSMSDDDDDERRCDGVSLMYRTSSGGTRACSGGDGGTMSSCSRDDDEDDDDESMKDAGQDNEVFETYDEDDFGVLLEELAEMGPAFDDVKDEEYNNLEKLRLRVKEQHQALILSARIGQNLLTKNTSLVTQTKELEVLLENKVDEVNQLQHEKKKLKDDLRDRLYGDESDGVEKDTSLLEVSSTCCCCNEVGSTRALDKIKRLEEESNRKSSELFKLRDKLESERLCSKECSFELRRSFDVAEADVRQLRDKLMSKQRKITQHENDLHFLRRENRLLATYLAQMNIELDKQTNAFVKEMDSLRFRLKEATSQYEEYLARYNEMKTENAVLLQRLKRRSRHDLMSSRSQMSIAQELDLSNNSPAVTGSQDNSLTCSANSMCDTPLSILSRMAHNPNNSLNAWSYSAETEMVQVHVFPADDSMRNLIGKVLGQPGRPGSYDLDVAVFRLSINSGQGQILLGYSSSSNALRNGFSKYAALQNNSYVMCESGRKSVDSGYGCSNLRTEDNVHNGLRPKTSKTTRFTQFHAGSHMLQSWRQLSTPHLATMLQLPDGVLVRCDVDAYVRGDHSALRHRSSFYRPPCSSGGGGVMSLADLRETDSISTCEEDLDLSSIASSGAETSDIEDDSAF